MKCKDDAAAGWRGGLRKHNQLAARPPIRWAKKEKETATFPPLSRSSRLQSTTAVAKRLIGKIDNQINI